MRLFGPAFQKGLVTAGRYLKQHSTISQTRNYQDFRTAQMVAKLASKPAYTHLAPIQRPLYTRTTGSIGTDYSKVRRDRWMVDSNPNSPSGWNNKNINPRWLR